MKILFNTYYHAFQNPGGGEIVLKKTKEALERKGIQVDLFDQWKTKISDYDILHNFSTLNYRDFDGYKAYVKKLIVTPVMWPDVSTSAVCREKIKSSLNRLMGKNSSEVNFTAALRHVDKFFPTTEMEWDRIKKRYSLTNKAQIIYNGVDLPKTPGHSFSDQFKVSNYILYVGRLSPLKNVERIIQAARMSGQKIVLVGKADLFDREYEKDLHAKYKNDSNILFTGAIENNSQLLNDAYFEAKKLIVASLFETCSLTGLEAGIRGTPVIMTQNGATKEVYQNFVEYIDPLNVADMAEKMGHEFSQEKKSALQHFIQEKYSWDHIASLMVNEYSETLKT